MNSAWFDAAAPYWRNLEPWCDYDTSLDIDGEGRINAVVADVGADECWLRASILADAKRCANDMGADLSGLAVSAAFPNYFYVEKSDRSSGIRVEQLGHSFTTGDKADVSGMVKTNADGERFIDAATAVRTGASSVTALGMDSNALGGGSLFCWARSGAGQSGVKDGFGLNNIGLLARCWGLIVERDSASPARWFKMDGGGVIVKCVLPSGVTIDPSWVYVGVTGISSCEKMGEELHRLLRVRTQDDITPY